jgi:hypothetical protein
MKRLLVMTVAAVAALTGCAQALASATAVVPASVTVDQAAGINVVAPLVLPTISTTPVITSPVVTAPAAPSAGSSTVSTSATGTGAGASATGGSSSTGGTPTSNATLTIYGQSGDAVSMAVPETFKVIRTGGTETLTVKTNTNSSEYNVAQNGVILGGGLTGDTMSVNVGGSLSLASAGPLVPGPYEGMLVVVVQYN